MSKLTVHFQDAPPVKKKRLARRALSFFTSLLARFRPVANPTYSLKNAELLERSDWLAYLAQVRRTKEGKKIYGQLLKFLDERYRVTGLLPDDIQYLCNLLYNSPWLLSDFARLLPSTRTFVLSDDFDLTRLLLILVEEKVMNSRASFGLIDIDAREGEFPEADVHIRHLLSSALTHKEREEAMITLRGGDAQRALFNMQQAMDAESYWEDLIAFGTEGEISDFGGKEWKRTRRLLVKLAAWSDQIPPSLMVTGLQVDAKRFRGGGFADIYQGQHPSGKVAVKRLRIFSSISLFEMRALREVLYDEALVWRQLNHPRIMPFLGIDSSVFRDSDSRYCMIVPWADKSNVRTCITNLEESKYPAPVEKWLIEVAEGLLFLREEGVIHGDLRGNNILIGDQYEARLTDFGLADLIKTRTASIGRWYPEECQSRWVAPEQHAVIPFELTDFPDANKSISSTDSRKRMLPLGRPSFQGDIFSFACVCVELYSNNQPEYVGIPSHGRGIDRKVERAIVRGQRPIRPAALTSEELWSLVERCWTTDPEDRPVIQDVLSELRLLLEPVEFRPPA